MDKIQSIVARLRLDIQNGKTENILELVDQLIYEFDNINELTLPDDPQQRFNHISMVYSIVWLKRYKQIGKDLMPRVYGLVGIIQ
jgi:prephenate dehydrogenase